MNKVSVHVLEQQDFKKCINIFSRADRAEFTLELKSLLCGQTPGSIYADSRENPATALVWDKGHNFYILGNEQNKVFNELLSETIYRTIFKEARSLDNVLDFYIKPAYGETGQLEQYSEMIDILFKYNKTMRNKRRYYRRDLTGVKNDRMEGIHFDDTIKLAFINREFLKNTQLINYEEISNWIQDTWASQEIFFEKGFGFCLVKNDVIICWSLADYSVNMECEIGIETDEEYQRQGYAALLVEEVIRYCADKGFRSIGWQCREDNEGSWKTAEKTGFIRMFDYEVQHAWYNKLDNYLVNGFYYLAEVEDYSKAGGFYEQAFKLADVDDGHDSSILSDPDSVKWCYYNAVCAWALANNLDRAYSNLEKAIEAGWEDTHMLQTDDRLNNLRSDSRWGNIIRNKIGH